MADKTYEMFWDCAFCGTTRLLGKTHRFCANCGAPQDPAARYFPAEADKVAVEDHVYVGADRICANCSTPGSAAARHCTACGSPLGDDDATVALVSEPHPPAPAAPRRTARRPIVAVVVVALNGLLTVLLWKEEQVLTVSGHEWQRSVEVERLSAVRDGAWCDQVPSRASQRVFRVSRLV